MEKIWAQPQLLYSFWGPFMHSIYPKTKVFKKPHLKQIEISLLCLRLAYPRIADRLQEFIQNAQEPYLSHARNLWMAFQFFIPLVAMYFSLAFFVCLIFCHSSKRTRGRSNLLVTFIPLFFMLFLIAMCSYNWFTALPCHKFSALNHHVVHKLPICLYSFLLLLFASSFVVRFDSGELVDAVSRAVSSRFSFKWFLFPECVINIVVSVAKSRKCTCKFWHHH